MGAWLEPRVAQRHGAAARRRLKWAWRRRGGGSSGPGGGAAAALGGMRPAALEPLVVRVLGVWCLVCVYWHVDSVLLF